MMMINPINKQSDAFVPMYSSVFANQDMLKADSELTCSVPVSRKRSRDHSSMSTFFDAPNVEWNPKYTFVGEDMSSQIQQQQFEIDEFVVRHTEKVRVEMEERRKRYSMKLILAMEEGLTQRLRAKDDEIAKITKLNYALEDKVKSLCIENQIWRELAQTNEATANALRSNLKQVMEHFVSDEYRAGEDAAEDAQSCCESNNDSDNDSVSSYNMKRLCKMCGEVESCVLLLPCRHLCLCNVCVSSVDNCPICKSAKKISVHVHL